MSPGFHLWPPHLSTGAFAWDLSCLSSEQRYVATVPVLSWKIVGEGHEKPGLGPPGHLSLRPLSLGHTPDPSSEPGTREGRSLAAWILSLICKVHAGVHAGKGLRSMPPSREDGKLLCPIQLVLERQLARPVLCPGAKCPLASFPVV